MKNTTEKRNKFKVTKTRKSLMKKISQSIPKKVTYPELA